MVLESGVQNLIVPLVVEVLPLEVEYALGDDAPKQRPFVPVAGLLGLEVRQVSPVVAGLLLLLKLGEGGGGGLRF